ncbi:MAG: NUDIX domain-containing protein [Alicyclobacillaceae bacterium]|nr:NUDIX domain-containing protein [Alicyclobacillaceae bacterium]
MVDEHPPIRHLRPAAWGQRANGDMAATEAAEEYLDVYDDHLQPVGSRPRSVVHREGWWHRTFHCWLECRAGGGQWLLFQRRSRQKDTNPGKLDVACAGHLAAGERLADAVRELQEELGVIATFESLSAVGTIRHEHRQEGIVDREVCHVFWLAEAVSPSDLRPNPAEVEALVLIRREDFLDLLAGRVPHTVVHQVLDARSGHWRASGEQVQLADFVQRPPGYYRMVFGLPPIPSGR